MIDQIKAIQTRLGLTPDGIAGPLTWAAIARNLGSETVQTTSEDPRSARNIATLHEALQPLARILLQLAANRGIQMVVTSGLRNYDEQDALYEQGRTLPGLIVTNARGGYSNHNFGLAFDVTKFVDGRPIWEHSDYAVVGHLGKSVGLFWGGDWTKPDEPHFELRPEWAKDLPELALLAQLRKRKELKQDLLV